MTTVKQVFFSFTTEGYLVDTRVYQPFTLVGPSVLPLALDPLAAYTSTTIYISLLEVLVGANFKSLICRIPACLWSKWSICVIG